MLKLNFQVNSLEHTLLETEAAIDQEELSCDKIGIVRCKELTP